MVPEVTLINPGFVSTDYTFLLAQQVEHSLGVHCSLYYVALTVTLEGVAFHSLEPHLKMVTENRRNKGIRYVKTLLLVNYLGNLVRPPDVQAISL